MELYLSCYWQRFIRHSFADGELPLSNPASSNLLRASHPGTERPRLVTAFCVICYTVGLRTLDRSIYTNVTIAIGQFLFISTFSDWSLKERHHFDEQTGDIQQVVCSVDNIRPNRIRRRISKSRVSCIQCVQIATSVWSSYIEVGSKSLIVVSDYYDNSVYCHVTY